MTKSLSKAIALATLVGVSASAHAINVNHDGLGEVLLYSLYTTEEGNVTNFSITNTTDVAKAVKVRFLEGQNSQEVLDFHLYLSANDQWSGVITQTGEGAQLKTFDRSCTAPAIPANGVQFKDAKYKGKGGEQSLERTRVGHIEVIEMGVLDDKRAGYVTADHTKSGAAGTKPANCDALRGEFSGSGIWAGGNYLAGFLTAPEVEDLGVTGGLYGSASILNIEKSTQIAYDALALDNFLYSEIAEGPAPIHAATGNVLPSLDSGGNEEAVFKNGAKHSYQSSAEVISALLMKESISNDYVLDEGRGSETNWVVTFPTKRFHVDPEGSTSPADKMKPFTNAWAGGESCHEVSISHWDNEEYEGAPDDLQFSPMEDGKTNSLCYETNILTFNDAKVLGGKHVSYNVDLPQPDFKFGWMNIGFNSYSLEDVTTENEIFGLPAIGFSAVTIKNEVADNGLMNNYGSSTDHKANTTKDHVINY